MNATIGILTYKRLDMLSACLRSLYAATSEEGLRRVIVTNTSTDPAYIEDVGYLCRRHPGVTYHPFAENVGCARAWNWMGRWQPQTELVCIFNDDIKVFPGWEAAVQKTLSDPKMGLMSLSLANGKNEWYHQGERNPQCDAGGLPLSRYVCTYPTGALLMMRRPVFDEAGGFDENFFQSLEEVDLGVRLAQKGYVNANVGASGEAYKFAAHYGSASGGCTPIEGDISPEAHARRMQNRAYFERKHGFPFPLPQEVEARLTAHMRG